MKRVLCLILAAVLLVSTLCACGSQNITAGGRLELPEEVNRVDAIFSIYSSYLYSVSDPEAIGKILDMLRSLEVTRDDDAPVIVDVCTVSLSHYGEREVSYGIAEEGCLYIYDEGEESTPYRITSDFDLEQLKTLISENDDQQKLK